MTDSFTASDDPLYGGPVTDELLTTSNQPLDLPDDLDPTSLGKSLLAGVTVGLLTAGGSVAALLSTDTTWQALLGVGLAEFCATVLAVLGFSTYVRHRATPVSTAAAVMVGAQMDGERAGMAMGRGQTIADLELLDATRGEVTARDASDTFEDRS